MRLRPSNGNSLSGAPVQAQAAAAGIKGESCRRGRVRPHQLHPGRTSTRDIRTPNESSAKSRPPNYNWKQHCNRTVLAHTYQNHRTARYRRAIQRRVGARPMFSWVIHRQCPGCHGTEVSARSQATFWDRILQFVFIRALHCDFCGRRFYGWLRINA